MTRTTGSKNIPSFEKYKTISSTASQDIKHLAKSNDDRVVQQFKNILRHQRNYLSWLETRHKELNEAKKELSQLKQQKYRGPKSDTYRKYKWYAEHAMLLESINAFEVFYKNSIINLAKSIRNFIPPEKLNGSIDVKILWGLRSASVPELVFEHQLYHDLDNVDKVCNSLIGAKRYNKNNPDSKMRDTNLALQAIFQIRHTLSHNHGVITHSDLQKLKLLGYTARHKEVIDPMKNNLGRSIMRYLETEAEDFTKWMLQSTATFLEKQAKVQGFILDKKTYMRIVKILGDDPKLAKLPWV